MKANAKNKGFTLIELLVVIAIIALLSATIFAALSTARQKARDANRIATARSLKTALALYEDKYGSVIGINGLSANASGTPILVASGTLSIADVLKNEGFLDRKVAGDSVYGTSEYYLGVASDGRYDVYAKLERPESSMTSSTITAGSDGADALAAGYNYASGFGSGVGTSGGGVVASGGGGGSSQTLWEFTIPGGVSFTPTTSGTYEILVVGGGGGGGNGGNCAACWGSGAGSGRASKISKSLTAGVAYTGTLGDGGTSGVAGGTTSFAGAATSTGGSPGVTASTGGAGGSGGAAAGVFSNGYGPGGSNGSAGTNSAYNTGGAGQGANYYSSLDSTTTPGAGGQTANGSTGGTGGGGGGGGGFGTSTPATSGQDSTINSTYSNGSIGGAGGQGYGGGGGGAASISASGGAPFPQGGKGNVGYIRIKYVGP